MVGFLEQDKYDKFDFDFPKIENKKISDFLEEDVDDKYYFLVSIYSQNLNND